jgi:hypothetical protein
MPGPMPKRSDERTRKNKDESGLELKKGVARGYKRWPKADPEWHPRAKEVFASLGTSGMEAFYEESDIAYAKLLCDALTDWYAGKSAMKLQAILGGLANLGMTEGERRKMRIELELPEIPEESAGARAQRMWQEKLSAPATITPIRTEENPA